MITFKVGDVFDRMADIPDHSVDLIVTSPPFLALRSYLPDDHPNKTKEIGSEPTPAAYISTLLRLSEEWRRLLAPHGSICVELGDTYSGSGGEATRTNNLYNTANRYSDEWNKGNTAGKPIEGVPNTGGKGWPLAKSLCGIPTLYAWSLAYGHNLLDPADVIEPWRVRNLIVWHRPNPPVGGLGDKVRPSTSYITTACMSDKRWFDLDAERTPWTSATEGGMDSYRSNYNGGYEKVRQRLDVHGGAPPLDCWIDGDVWTIPTAPYKGAHYATYPPALPRRLIRLMCPQHVCVVCGEPRRRITSVEYEGTTTRRPTSKASLSVTSGVSQGHHAFAEVNPNVQRETLGWSDCGHNNWRRGHVLDCFGGSGTTGQAAIEQGRNATLIDLDERNLDLARQRIGLFLEEEEAV